MRCRPDYLRNAEVAYHDVPSVNSSKRTLKTGCWSGHCRAVPKNLSKLLRYLLRMAIKLCFCRLGWDTDWRKIGLHAGREARILQPDRAMGLGIRLRMRCYRGCAVVTAQLDLCRKAAFAGALRRILGKVRLRRRPGMEGCREG